MNIQLICSKNRKVITEILNERGIRISDDADIVLVERGAALPEPGIAIVYDSQDLNPLIDFLDHLGVSSKKTDLEIIPVLNKIDLPGAQPEEVKDQIVDLLGIDGDEVIYASAKEGIGIDDILEAIINRIPAPKGDRFEADWYRL